MAVRAEQIGVTKAKMPLGSLLVLGILAGAFIALGAVFSTVVTVDTAGVLPHGVRRLLGGLAFCLGLILVIVGGAELFTGNNLIVMALASRRISIAQLLKSWAVVYCGNFVGAVATAVILFVAQQHLQHDGQVGRHALEIAAAKCSLEFWQAFALGVLCNALVCLAVWLCFSAHSTTDKIVAILFPISAFVAAGFEHCVANMYFVPLGLFIRSFAPPEFWLNIGMTAADFNTLSWTNFWWVNLLPVTMGNIVGGTVMVGLVYWFLYLRKQ